MIGSLILKIAGPIDKRPNVFNSLDLERVNKIHNPKLAAPPPKLITYHQNGCVKK